MCRYSGFSWHGCYALPYSCSVRFTPLACRRGLPPLHLLRLHRSLLSRLAPSPMRPHISEHTQYRNLHLLSIDYAFRPRLRSRLTQGRSALPWNPWIFGRKDSHLPLATHSGILSSRHSTAPFGTASPHRQCSPTSPVLIRYSQASAAYFSPGYFRRRASRLVSYYALF